MSSPVGEHFDFISGPTVDFQPFLVFDYFAKRKQNAGYRVHFLTGLAFWSFFITFPLCILMSRTPISFVHALIATFLASIITTTALFLMRRNRFGGGGSGLRAGLIVSAILMGWSALVTLIWETSQYWLPSLWLATFVYTITVLLGLLSTRSWMVEIDRGQIYYYKNHNALSKDIESRSRPHPDVPESLYEALESIGISRDVIDKMFQDSQPEHMESTLAQKAEAFYNKVRFEKAVTAWQQSTLKTVPDPHNLTSEERENFIAAYVSDAELQRMRRFKDNVLHRFFDLVHNSLIDPVIWICPRDIIGLFWDQDDRVTIDLTIDNILTRKGVGKAVDAPSFNCTLRFAVTADPRQIKVPSILNKFAQQPTKDKLKLMVEGALSNSAINATRNFFKTKTLNEIFTPECMEEFRHYFAHDALEAIENSIGVEIQDWSVVYMPLEPELLAQAAEAAQAERIKIEQYIEILEMTENVSPETAQWLRNLILVREMPANARGSIPMEAMQPPPPPVERRLPPLLPTRPAPPEIKPALDPDATVRSASSMPTVPSQPPDENVIEGNFEIIDIDDDEW